MKDRIMFYGLILLWILAISIIVTLLESCQPPSAQHEKDTQEERFNHLTKQIDTNFLMMQMQIAELRNKMKEMNIVETKKEEKRDKESKEEEIVVAKDSVELCRVDCQIGAGTREILESSHSICVCATEIGLEAEYALCLQRSNYLGHRNRKEQIKFCKDQAKFFCEKDGTGADRVLRVEGETFCRDILNPGKSRARR